MENRAVFMSGTNNMVFKDVPIPEPGPKDVLVKVDVVGICGSDVHYYKNGRIGDFVVEGDFILGHECSGEIVKIGNSVDKLKVGDRVTLEPGKTCGKCVFCKTGRYNLCPDVAFFATPPYHGVLQNYVTHPEDMCFKLPDNVSNLEGSLVEPLCVGLHAANQGEVTLGNTVVIFGAGCIGLVTLLSAKARGASNIIVTDVFDNRLAMAKKLGATSIINAKNMNVPEKINELTTGEGADVVIDTAGAEITYQQTVDAVKRGGTIVLVGMTSEEEVKFNFMKLMSKEGSIKTIFRYRNLYPMAINALSSGAINVKEIVSHEFPFDKAKEAFDFVSNHASEVIKAVIKIS